MRKVVLELAVATANALTFVLGWVVGYTVVFRFLHGVLSLGRVAPGYEPPLTWYQGFVLSLCIAFVVFGDLTRVWTRHVLNVAVVSASIVLLGMIALAQAMYLADRGDPSIMWSYIRPGQEQFLGTLSASAAAVLGWYLAGRLKRQGAGLPGEPGLV